MTIVLYLWQKAFGDHQFGYGAAIGWALFVIVAVFAAINWRLVARFGEDRPATSRRGRFNRAR
jgi:cellobiose transport system permease protein